ncbi:MAG: prephenate dehydrogenase [Aggregatilineales bacterium]
MMSGRLTNLSVCVIGLGLMGGSLALALRDKVKTIGGIDRNSDTRRTAAPFLGRVTAELNAVADFDLVILATPARTILALLPEIAPHLRPGTLIMDLGSVKVPIVTAMRALPEGVFALGGHPMCGKETSGFTAADAMLYAGCTFALCECDPPRNRPEHRALAEALVETIGARPCWIGAGVHDRCVATISHLPYLMSMALVAQTLDDRERETLLALASTGFRDTTRLAGSDLAMMGDVLALNTDAVQAAWNGVQSQLDTLLTLFQTDSKADRAHLAAIRESRREWGEQFERKTRKPKDPGTSQS